MAPAAVRKDECTQYRDKYGSITVYGKADGDYFVFYSYDTDKEVWRVKCPVIRESEVEEG